MTQPLKKLNIIVIGCGKMGASMIHGWLAANLINHAQILDPHDIDDSLSSHPDLFHVKLMESLFKEGQDHKTDIIILAVKPQIMDMICQQLQPILPDGIPVISIAAGKSIASFQNALSAVTPIIRTMPNIPAAIGKGMTALCASTHVTDDHKVMATRLMDAIGQTTWIDDEAQMDAITAVSGSGPAYVFYLIEAMASAGEKAGLSKKQAMQCARQTIIGAAALAEHEDQTDAATLRQNVTSPGGTTQAALDVLMDGSLQDIIDKAIAAAHKRGKELAE